jgi:hypothetical protein
LSDNFVANNPQTFTVGTESYTAYGYAGAPGTSTPTALTLKPLTVNSFDESGLGENAAGPPGGTACSDSDCEIAGSASVALISNTPLTAISIIVGSVQFFEGFVVYTGNTLADLTPIETVVNPINCIEMPDSDTCTVALPGVLAVGVQNFGIGDVLVTELSSVPAPVIGRGLPALLAVACILFGAKLLDQSKKRNSPVGDSPHVSI